MHMHLDTPTRLPAAEATAATWRTELAARARQHAGHSLATCLAWLETPLLNALQEFDQRLFTMADRARNHLEQQACFESRNTLERGGEAFRARFAAGLRDRFVRLGELGRRDGGQPERIELSLVDTVEQEESDALAVLASRAEARHASHLFELGYRLAVLAASPPLEGEAQPAGPRALVAVLRDAAAPLHFSPAHRLLFFQAFENAMMASLDTLYGALNDHLRENGILPHLRVNAYARPAVAAPRATPARSPEPEASVRDPAPAAPTDHLSVLESLRDLLAQRVQHTGGARAASIPARIASADELQIALGALQGHLSDVAGNASREIRSAQRLRAELIAQLSANRPPGSPPVALTPEHSDTVELTAMLFENIAQELTTTGTARSLLGGMQWPVLRTAVSDKAFFEQQDHPARRLLNTVAEAANDWIDRADGDSALQEKLERVVGEVATAPAIDPRWVADIENHVAALSRKAQVAERRLAEAMEGRERLAQARRRAGELMAERMTTRSPRGVLKILLERTWSDVLALNLLRSDEGSPAFAACLDITDQLLGRQPIVNLAHLQAEVETRLQHVGMHADEAAEVARRLLRQQQDDDAALTNTDIALRLKQRPRFGEEVLASAGETAPAPVEERKLSTPARAQLAALRQREAGTWYEFTQFDGSIVRRKLAWYSPTGDRALFVNANGVRAEDRTLSQLANDLARGTAREWVAPQSSLMERAWQAIAGSLRRGPAGPTSTARAS
jgi:hypothetical protein